MSHVNTAKTHPVSSICIWAQVFSDQEHEGFFFGLQLSFHPDNMCTHIQYTQTVTKRVLCIGKDGLLKRKLYLYLFRTPLTVTINISNIGFEDLKSSKYKNFFLLILPLCYIHLSHPILATIICSRSNSLEAIMGFASFSCVYIHTVCC